MNKPVELHFMTLADADDWFRIWKLENGFDLEIHSQDEEDSTFEWFLQENNIKIIEEEDPLDSLF